MSVSSRRHSPHAMRSRGREAARKGRPDDPMQDDVARGILEALTPGLFVHSLALAAWKEAYASVTATDPEPDPVDGDRMPTVRDHMTVDMLARVCTYTGNADELNATLASGATVVITASPAPGDTRWFRVAVLGPDAPPWTEIDKARGKTTVPGRLFEFEGTHTAQQVACIAEGLSPQSVIETLRGAGMPIGFPSPPPADPSVPTPPGDE